MLAVYDGLAARVYDEPRAQVGEVTISEAVLAILRDSVGDIFTGQCRRYGGSA